MCLGLSTSLGLEHPVVLKTLGKVSPNKDLAATSEQDIFIVDNNSDVIYYFTIAIAL